MKTFAFIQNPDGTDKLGSDSYIHLDGRKKNHLSDIIDYVHRNRFVHKSWVTEGVKYRVCKGEINRHRTVYQSDLIKLYDKK